MQFQHLLQQAIARTKRDRRYLAILYLDVDRFKDINDTFGHSAGDSALEIFSQRISDVLPPESVPGRLAGDEFCVLLKTSSQIDAVVEEVNAIGQKLLHSVGRPFRVQGEEIFMSTSIGAAIYPRDGENVVDLLRNADAALYQAKRAGGNCIEFFGQHIAKAGEERLMLKSKLRRAFAQARLSAKVPTERRTYRRRRGPDPLGSAGTRHRSAVRLHSHCRRKQPDSATRRMGARSRLQRLPGLAARPAFAVPRIVESVAETIASTALFGRLSQDVQAAQRFADLFRARNYRDHVDARRRSDDQSSRRALRHGSAFGH
jgi:diguanylate cyclase (GGDEF)-like protein